MNNPIEKLREEFIELNPHLKFEQIRNHEDNSLISIVVPKNEVSSFKNGLFKPKLINSKETNDWINFIRQKSDSILNEHEQNLKKIQQQFKGIQIFPQSSFEIQKFNNRFPYPKRGAVSLNFGIYLLIEERFYNSVIHYISHVNEKIEEAKVQQEIKRQQQKEIADQQRIDYIRHQQRLKENKILAEAQRRIKAIAEQTEFEAAVQQKMKQLLSSDSTLNDRMKVREAELQDLFA